MSNRRRKKRRGPSFIIELCCGILDLPHFDRGTLGRQKARRLLTEEMLQGLPSKINLFDLMSSQLVAPATK